MSSVYGEILFEYDYNVFGGLRNTSGSGYNPMQFTGEYFDDPGGLLYLRARYYDPGIGRFITPDSYTGTLNDPLSQNLYAYCGNNPVAYVDPSGHLSICPAAAWDAAAGTFTGAAEGAAVGGSRAGYWGSVIGSVIGGILGNPEATVDQATEEDLLRSSESEPTMEWPGNDPTVAPGNEWEWRGTGEQGSKEGSYYNPNTGESLHPDLDHEAPIGPHWDYRAPDGSQWRVYPDGRLSPKSKNAKD